MAQEADSATVSGTRLNLRYDANCSECGSRLQKGTNAWWLRGEKRAVCLSCRPAETGEGSAESVRPERAVELLTTVGIPGSSARREGERRAAKRERDTLARHPRVGKLLLRVTEEPQSIRAWDKGAVGEEALGARLSELASEQLVVLHDRRVPPGRGNIDHIVVTSRGVYVIDAKHYRGRVEQRDRGNFFRHDFQLHVGRRNCSNLLDGAERQGDVVRGILTARGLPEVPVRPTLCFINAEWDLFASAFELRGVIVTWPKFLYGVLGKEGELSKTTVQQVAGELAAALPAAKGLSVQGRAAPAALLRSRGS